MRNAFSHRNLMVEPVDSASRQISPVCHAFIRILTATAKAAVIS